VHTGTCFSHTTLLTKDSDEHEAAAKDFLSVSC
jgi:hypothetical protein